MVAERPILLIRTTNGNTRNIPQKLPIDLHSPERPVFNSNAYSHITKKIKYNKLANINNRSALFGLMIIKEMRPTTMTAGPNVAIGVEKRKIIREYRTIVATIATKGKIANTFAWRLEPVKTVIYIYHPLV
jgi:hypothetical protein